MAAAAKDAHLLFHEGCQARAVLDRVSDKWSLAVVSVLGEDELRFTELKRRIEGISQRMLTVTLRALERDGILIRTVYSPMPPNIAYRLTALGTSLWVSLRPLITWASTHHQIITAAQHEYDRQRATN